MRKKQLRTILIIAAVVVVLAGVTVLAVNNYGSASDPLVSMSYINQTLTPSLQSKFSTQLDAKAQALQNSFASAVSEKGGGFATVTMTKGQKLTCSAGSELLLVSGSAKTVSAGIITDVTAGTAAGAALQANHLYMTVSEGAAITAAGAVTVMVRGTSTVA
jgi:hypothetical protein